MESVLAQGGDVAIAPRGRARECGERQFATTREGPPNLWNRQGGARHAVRKMCGGGEGRLMLRRRFDATTGRGFFVTFRVAESQWGEIQ